MMEQKQCYPCPSFLWGRHNHLFCLNPVTMSFWYSKKKKKGNPKLTQELRQHLFNSLILYMTKKKKKENLWKDLKLDLNQWLVSHWLGQNTTHPRLFSVLNLNPILCLHLHEANTPINTYLLYKVCYFLCMIFFSRLLKPLICPGKGFSVLF